jgi:hypothetical protein
MNQKTETAMMPMDAQPVYLIAGQSTPEQPGLSVVDALIWAYRRRWWLAVWFVVLMGVQVGMLMQAKQLDCVFTVRAERGSVESVVVALQEDLAWRGDSVRALNPQIEFQKMGTGAKAEQAKNLVLVKVADAVNDGSPTLIEGLRTVAQAACARAVDEYLKQAGLGVQLASERVQALRADSNATVAERSAAEMSLANARVALETPLVLKVSEIQRNPVTSGFSKRAALAAALAICGSLLLVGAGSGYGEIRRRAAQS